MADIVIRQIEEGMTGRQVADLLYQNFLALLNAGVDVDDLRGYFLNKDREETARYLLTFLAGIKVGDAVDGMLGGRGTIATADGRVQTDIMQLRKALTIGRQGFEEGMTGYGGHVDADGNAEFESLVLRRFLEVPELRYRRTEVIVGDKWRAPGGGVIERVEPILNNGQPTGEGYIWLKLEDGEIGAIAPNDICMGIFHDYKNKANNATADADDGKGNRTFAGFCTVYFRIEEVSDVTDESGTHVKKLARYSIRQTSATWQYSHEPMEQMTFVVYGNFTDVNRQTSVYETRTYTRMLKNQNSWEFGYHNIALQYGDFKNIGEAFGRPVADGYALFVGSIYMAGTLTQVTASGEEVRAVVDRGAWTAGTTAGYYERFSYDGSLWLCVAEGGTTSAPSATEPAWLLQVAAGASITSDNDWKSKNTPYKVNTIVPFAGRMFITTEETNNPPLGLLTDESGNYITDETGGYLIVDEATSAGWQLLLDISGVTNGEDGASVEVQWSKDGNSWHAAYTDGDLYMRQRVGDAAWGAAIRVVGENGKDGYNQTFEFAVSNSLTEQPLSGWSDAPRPVGSGEYLWMRTGTIIPPATRPATWTVVRIGGEKGADGVGINSVTITYGKSNSVSVKPTTWSNDVPVVGEDEVLWVRTITDYTDETKADTVSYMYSYQGKTGAAGTSVSVVSIEYQAGASATTPPTGEWSEDVVKAVDGMYLWTRTTFSDGSVAYGISKQGKDGQDGADGKDGQGFAPRGEWATVKMPAKVGDVFRMGGAAWVAVRETENPPMWTITDEEGNRLMREDGGYLLTGEVNDAEWDLWVEDGKNGEPGKNGLDGQDGLDGKDGKDGANAIVADMSNEMDSVALTADGKTTETSTMETIVAVWNGQTKAALKSIQVSAIDGVTARHELQTGKVTLTIAEGVALAASNAVTIKVVAEIAGADVERTLTFTIVGVRAGKDGESAVLYKLLLSVNSIVKKSDGTYNVEGVNAVRCKIENGVTSITTEGKLKYLIDDKGIDYETEIGNAVDIPAFAFADRVRFTFYGDNGAILDRETVPMLTDGEGFEVMGEYYTGMQVPKNGVVLMGGSSFVAKVATENPPLWTLTDENGNRLTDENGGYLLTGEVNNEEYELMAERGEDGEPGKDGENGKDGAPGKDGQNGARGYAGAVTRTWQGYEAGRTYRNDTDAPDIVLEPGGVRYKDVVLVENSQVATGYDVYECLITNTGRDPREMEYDANGVSVDGRWRMATNMAAAFVTSFVAINANIKFAASGQLAILDENNKVCAGMAGTQAGKKTRIWAGGDNPDEAPFRVDQKGETWLENAHITGEVNATSGNFNGVVIKGNLRTPWKKISANPIVDANGGNLRYEFLGNTITDDKLILNSMVGATLKIAWFEDADGREIAIYNQVPLIGSGGGGDVKIIIPSGCSIVTSEAIYEDEYILKAGYLYYLSGMNNMWVVKQIVNIQKLF